MFKVGHYYKSRANSSIWLWLKVEKREGDYWAALLLDSKGTIVKYWYEKNYSMYWEELK